MGSLKLTDQQVQFFDDSIRTEFIKKKKEKKLIKYTYRIPLISPIVRRGAYLRGTTGEFVPPEGFYFIFKYCLKVINYYFFRISKKKNIRNC